MTELTSRWVFAAVAFAGSLYALHGLLHLEKFDPKWGEHRQYRWRERRFEHVLAIGFLLFLAFRWVTGILLAPMD